MRWRCGPSPEAIAPGRQRRCKRSAPLPYSPGHLDCATLDGITPDCAALVSRWVIRRPQAGKRWALGTGPGCPGCAARNAMCERGSHCPAARWLGAVLIHTAPRSCACCRGGGQASPFAASNRLCGGGCPVCRRMRPGVRQRAVGTCSGTLGAPPSGPVQHPETRSWRSWQCHKRGRGADGARQPLRRRKCLPLPPPRCPLLPWAEGFSLGSSEHWALQKVGNREQNRYGTCRGDTTGVQIGAARPATEPRNNKGTPGTERGRRLGICTEKSLGVGYDERGAQGDAEIGMPRGGESVQVRLARGAAG